MSDKKIKEYYANIIREALKEVENRQNNKEEQVRYGYKKILKKYKTK